MKQLGNRVLVAALLAGLLATVGCSSRLSEHVDLPGLRPLSHAERVFREGERLAAEGQDTRALLAFRQAYTADRSYEPALARLAAAYEAQGRRRLAAYFYGQLLARNPQDAETRQALANLHEALGQHERANQVRQGLGGVASEARPAGQATTAGARLSLMWETFLEEHAISGLNVAGDTVYATTQGGSLFALDRRGGALRWSFAAPKPIVSSPVHSPGPDEPLVLFGAEDDRLYAVSAVDGRERWHFQARGPIQGSPAAAGYAVYFGSTDGSLYAVQRSTGNLLWQFATGEPIHAAPLVAGDTVYVGSLDDNIYAIEARTGAERWRFAAVAGVESTPSLLADLLFAAANDSRLYCLNAADGAEVWRFSTGDAIYARPVVSEKAVYVASASHSLYALAHDTGELLWQYDGEAFLTTAPAFDGHVLYLTVSGDPHLYAIDAETGSVLWTLDTGDWPTAEPLLDGKDLFLGEKDGTVLAYRLP